MNLYSTKAARIVWFIKRFGAREVFLKPLRLILADWIVPRLTPTQFQFRGQRYSTFFARYNMTWVGERMVEIPIGRAIVARNAPDRVLEIGNVLSHYGPTSHAIVDKYEKAPNVINSDILSYSPKNQFDLIISISTFEHIGFDDDNDGSSGEKIASAIRHCRSLLSKTGRLIITFPTGYNPELDSAVRTRHLTLLIDPDFRTETP
jgi:SAM-dependent methyltransferase